MASKKETERIRGAILRIQKLDSRNRTHVELKSNRENYRAWKAAVTLRLNSARPTDHGLRFSLVDVFEGKLDKEEYKQYEGQNEHAYDLELDLCKQHVTMVLAQMVHSDHMEDLLRCDDVSEWLRDIRPPDDAATASYLLREMSGKRIDDFAGLEDYLSYMWTTYQRIRQCNAGDEYFIGEDQLVQHTLQGIAGDTRFEYELNALYEEIEERGLTFDKVKRKLRSKHSRLRRSDRVQARVATESKHDEEMQQLREQITALQTAVDRQRAPQGKNGSNRTQRHMARRGRQNCRNCGMNNHDTSECNKERVCYRCNKPGHYARECRAPAPARRATQSSQVVTFMAVTGQRASGGTDGKVYALGGLMAAGSPLMPRLGQRTHDGPDDQGCSTYRQDAEDSDVPRLVTSSDESSDSEEADDGSHGDELVVLQSDGHCRTDASDDVIGAGTSLNKGVSLVAKDECRLSVDKDACAISLVLDSGCSKHMVNVHHGLLTNVRERKEVINTAGTGNDIVSTHEGTLSITIRSDVGGSQQCQLSNVLVVPKLSHNLMSVKQAISSGNVMFGFKDDHAEMSLRCGTKVTIPSSTTNHGLFVLSATITPPRETLSLRAHSHTQQVDKDEQGLLDLHRRLGHKSLAEMKRLVKLEQAIHTPAAVKKLLLKTHHLDCAACTHAKAKRMKIQVKRDSPLSTTPGEILHCDTAGPFEAQFGGYNRLSVIVDEASDMVLLRPLRSVMDAAQHVKDTCELVHNKSGRYPKVLQTDNGVEYTNKKLLDYLARRGIETRRCVPYKHQQNGRAERRIRTLVEGGLSGMLHSKLPYNFLFLSIQHFADVTNSLPRDGRKSASEAFFSRGPAGLRCLPFGCLVQPVIPAGQRRAHTARVESAIFVGYDTTTKGGCLVYRPGTNAIVTRSHGEINASEGTFPGLADVESPSPRALRDLVSEFISGDTDSDTDGTVDDDEEARLPDNVGAGVEQEAQSHDSDDDDDDMNDPGGDVEPHGLPLDAIARWDEEYAAEVARLARAGVFEHHHIALVANRTDILTPVEDVSWNKLMRSVHCERFVEAAVDEMKSHLRCDTMSFVYDAPAELVIGSRWVCRDKILADDSVMAKVRLVGKGFAQIPGVHYEESYAPTVLASTTRLLFAVAAAKGWALRQLDVKTAFLIPRLPESELLYLRPPKDFRQVMKRLDIHLEQGVLLKLNAAIYGLRQAGHYWNNEITAALLRFGLTRSEHDPCLFMKFDDGALTLMVALYVDDVCAAGLHSEVQLITTKLFSEFPMKDLGEPQVFCGVQVGKADDGSISLVQTRYIEALLKNTNHHNAKSVPTPTATHRLDCTTPSTATERATMADVPYPQTVGCLLWLTTNTRPDIAFAVHQVARCVADPRPVHWTAVKRILRYLRGTSHFGLRFPSSGNGDMPQLSAYTDSDWAGDSTRRTTSCFQLFIGTAPLQWHVRLTRSVCLSSMESELVALCEGVKTLVHTIRIVADLGGLQQQRPFRVSVDSDAARLALRRPGPSRRSRHIEVRHFWVKERIDDGTIVVTRVEGTENPADIGTKPLAASVFVRLAAILVTHIP